MVQLNNSRIILKKQKLKSYYFFSLQHIRQIRTKVMRWRVKGEERKIYKLISDHTLFTKKIEDCDNLIGNVYVDDLFFFDTGNNNSHVRRNQNLNKEEIYMSVLFFGRSFYTSDLIYMKYFLLSWNVVQSSVGSWNMPNCQWHSWVTGNESV